MKNALWFGLALLAAGLVHVNPASAQRSNLPDKSIGVAFALQAGGHIRDDLDRGRFGRDWDRLDATVGAHVHWDKLVLERPKPKVTLGLSLGVLGRILTWQEDLFERRNLLLDTAFRVRFVIGFKKDFAFYLGPEIGPTLLSVLNKDYVLDDRARPGLNVSFVALGFEWWWNPKHSLFVELGWAGHWLYHGPYDPTLSQALIAIGVNFGR